ncbi:anaerobic sulfatase maturase [Lacrimispora sp.]|uniref:anaerobic sulfatase maturase n=1 Tax=Lacrimispora sp. TaxID=2719234 RepID=UPI0029E18663|nr:uncharacterized protein [Lacrimispora sp.]
MPPVNLLIKPASGLCNMECDYCFYCDESEKRRQASYGFMSKETLINVMRKTLSYGEQSVGIAFQGGEPTLCGIDFFEEAVRCVKQYNVNNLKIEYALQTNGYSITEEWCEFFKKNHFLVGLSVDGMEETHDKYRHSKKGKGTYQKVLNAARLMKKSGVDFNILTVVNKETAENIISIYKEYKRNGWEYLQFIACLDPLGETRGQREYSLTPKAYGEFLIKLFHLWYKDWKRGKQPYIRQFENYIGILLKYEPESCEQRGICGIQNVVEADGGVYPCDFYVLDEFKLGNLNQDTMAKIQERRSEIGFVDRSLNHSEDCRQCRWFSLCRGGCYRCREGVVDNYFCESYRMFFENCFTQMEEISRFLLATRYIGAGDGRGFHNIK